jgi:hypothetical protein
MRDSDDAKVRFLWERMLVSTRPDPSDAGMAYFLATGDEQADPEKLKRLLDDNVKPAPIAARSHIRLEAEDFHELEGCEVEDRNDRTASHRLQVRLKSDAGQIRTRFDEPYAPAHAQYDIDVRYFDDSTQRCRYRLTVRGAGQGEPWESPSSGQGWTTHSIRDVEVRAGDEIAVELRGASGKLDYVQLRLHQRSDASF